MRGCSLESFTEADHRLLAVGYAGEEHDRVVDARETLSTVENGGSQAFWRRSKEVLPGSLGARTWSLWRGRRFSRRQGHTGDDGAVVEAVVEPDKVGLVR